jgi:hypothetical protein
MPVIAVINRKGGSGKSTVAAHLASWYAHGGHSVMLGDVDRQQSSRSWLRRRPPSHPAISPWGADQNILRVPKGISHIILDTPGGLHGFDLARLVMTADAIVMPVCDATFDKESAASCYAELKTLPRVSAGRCKIACFGMRLNFEVGSGAALQAWAEHLDLLYVGGVRDTRLYAQYLEQGLTLFDSPAGEALEDKAHWGSLLNWLLTVSKTGRKSGAVAASSQISQDLPELSSPHPRSLRAVHTVRVQHA